MARNKKAYYIAKGGNDEQAWLFYGDAPYINENKEVDWGDNTRLVGMFENTPISAFIADNSVIKISIRTLKTINYDN